VGSSPIIRFEESPAQAGFFALKAQGGQSVEAGMVSL
jgi:hypothetical protein